MAFVIRCTSNVVPFFEVPAQCITPSEYTASLVITNESRRMTIEKVSLGYRSFQADFWSTPEEISGSIRPGKSKTLDLSHLKIRIHEYKLKWYISGQKYLIESTHPGVAFFQCIGLWYQSSGGYADWNTTRPISSRKSSRK